MDLTVEIFPGLSAKDPLMIASSHWTASETALQQIALVSPAAITLKTTSARFGGDGKESAGRSREKRDIRDHYGHIIAKFTDGAKPMELWDIATTRTQSQLAKEIFPSSRIGLSVLAGEDYQHISKALNLDLYDYVELNWKYAFRVAKQSRIPDIHADVRTFIKCFAKLRIVVKLSRESIPLLFSGSLDPVMKLVSKVHGSVIIANSKRIRVPPSRVVGSPRELSRGVVVGEYLFLETFDYIRQFNELKRFSGIPVIASGGVVDIAGIVDLLAIGVKGIQLCTALDLHGINLVSLLREQLSSVASDHATLEDFIRYLRASEANWLAAAAKARTAEYDEVRSVRSALNDQSGSVIEILGKTLLEECQIHSPQSAKKPVRRKSCWPKMVFIVNWGNVSACLLSSKAAEALGAATMDIKGFGDFITKLKDGLGFEYDFAIFSRSSLDFLQKDNAVIRPGLRPVVHAAVGASVWELVGDTRTPARSITHVYHFSGSSSRAAIDRLLHTIRPMTTQIIGSKLLPLFKFWHSDHGLLAKPPLSRIYGMLCGSGVSKHWGPLWGDSEELYLVMSERHRKAHGSKYATQAMSEIAKAKGLLLTNHLAAAKDLLASGYFSLFEAQILAGKQRDYGAS